MTVYFALMARGCSVVVMERFDPAAAAALIERERCTFTMLVPTMIQLFVNHPDVRSRDLSSLRVLLYAGSPITEQAIRDARALLGDVLYQTYGQSEGIPLTILTPADHARGIEGDRDILRSAGRPTPNSLVRIIDDEGNELGPGEVGEIAMYTPGQMRGLWNNPEASAERFTPDGFVKTRDIGYLDANGYLFLADRKEDMIISGGFNIWPAEIENALASHPAVLEVSVFGVPHPKWGETPVAVVVLRDGAAATDTELIDWCRQEIGSMKKPTRVEFRTQTLPKSAVGKVLRRSLRDAFAAPGPTAGPASG
jgi:acyl-CoA synthetase (AMP-forming)/AMP-acid ligase II